MRNDRLSDDEIAALLRGTAPHGRPDLEPLATLVDDLRFASSESSPRPSAAVTALLDADSALRISTAAAGGLSQRSDRMPAAASAVPAPRRGIASMFISWFTGLGLAAKIAIGAGAAALGVVGAGAAQALPPGIQQQFDGVVDTVVPAPEETDEPADDTAAVDDSTDDTATVDSPDTVETDDSGLDGVGDDDGTADQGPKTEHAQDVTEAAHDGSTEGREHGEAVSEAAHQNRGHGSANSGSGSANSGRGSDDGVDDDSDDSTDDIADDSSNDSDDSVEHESGDDNGTDSHGDGSGSGNSGNSGPGSKNSGRGSDG